MCLEASVFNSAVRREDGGVTRWKQLASMSGSAEHGSLLFSAPLPPPSSDYTGLLPEQELTHKRSKSGRVFSC